MAPAVFSPSIGNSLLLPGPRRRLWLLAGVYVACGIAFAADLTHDITWAFGLFYLPLVGTAALYRDPRWVWWLTLGAIGMVIAGFVVPVATISVEVLMNRILSISAILVTAVLLRWERGTQDRLAGQVRQAEAADRLKSQILANVNAELRAPAAAVISLAEALAAVVRPEHRGLLEQLRSQGGRLLTSIENLLDLAAADRTLRRQTIDLVAAMTEAVDAVRHSAAENHIWLESAFPPAGVPAIADAWALRRIVDNLIDNALKFTGANGHVRVGIETAPGHAAVVIEDSGPGIPEQYLALLGEPFLQASMGAGPQPGLGNGLALCRKLADAMGALLSFSSVPGQGTIVRLCLPAPRTTH